MKLKESQQQSNRLSNEDLVPLGQEKRTWKAMNFASIWMDVYITYRPTRPWED